MFDIPSSIRPSIISRSCSLCIMLVLSTSISLPKAYSSRPAVSNQSPSSKSQPATVPYARIVSPQASSLPSRIAFSSERDGIAQIYTMNPDGIAQSTLTSNSVGHFLPDWSPDGQHIAFTSTITENTDIYVMQADGRAVTRLTTDSSVDRKSTWSPDGKQVAFESDRGHRDSFDIYVMKVDGSGQKLLIDRADDRQPAWSPNGTRIAFVSNSGANYDIFVMNSDGTNITQLTIDPKGDWNPSWSPDGSRIAFMSERDGNKNIYVMNADGSQQTRLTTSSAQEEWPTWSPDGASLAFHASSDGTHNFEIYTIDATGANQNQLTIGGANDQYPDWSPALYPDITEIAPHSVVANAGDVPLLLQGKNLRIPMSVRVGNVDLTNVILESSTTVRVVVPISQLSQGSSGVSEGTYTISVISGGTTITLTDALTVQQAVEPTQFRVMVYMACDNNLERWCSELFNHLEEAMLASPNLRIAVLWDGRSEGDSAYYLVQPDADPDVWANYKDNETRFPLAAEADTGDARTLVAFAGWAQGQYPGNYKMLSLVGHGGGWAPDLAPGQPRSGRTSLTNDVGGMLWDEHPESSLTSRALAEALTWISNASPIEVLYLDSCLMSTIEIMAELAPTAHYIIAHESWTWAFFPYDAYLRDVSNTTTPREFAQHLADINRLTWSAREYPSQISVIDTSKIDPILTQLNQLTQAISATLVTSTGSITSSLRDAAHVDENADLKIDALQGDDMVDLGDLSDILRKNPALDATIHTAAENLLDALNAAIVTNYTQSGTPWIASSSHWNLDALHGLSIYWPLNDEWKRRYYNANALPRFAAQTSWDDMLQVYYRGKIGPELPSPCGTSCRQPKPAPIVTNRSRLALIQR
jgi:hypothetical protein